MHNKPIFYDSDVLICFLSVNEGNILKKLFSKIIVPVPVYDELIHIKKYENIKRNLKILIDENFVEICDIPFCSPVDNKYNLIYKGYWSDGIEMGRGEAAAIAFAIENEGIVASNNLSDILKICEDFEIPIITSSIIFAFCFELNLMSKDEIETVWKKILTNTNQKMPNRTFHEYYNHLFKNDCEDLLKNYDLKKYYKKVKKAKI